MLRAAKPSIGFWSFRNLDRQYQSVIDRYADLRNLTTFDIDGAKLFISVMLGAADFNYFVDLPFHALPANAEEQASVSEKYGYILVRLEGACHQRRRIPPRELSIDLVADERLGRATGRAEAS